jgi:hypothetical protein
MKKNLIVYLLTFIVLTEVKANFYVDPVNGSTSSGTTGTLADPFKTIEQARNAVRLVNSNMTSDIYVYLRGGEYSLSNTLTFSSQDGGSNGYKVIYKAFGIEKPIVSGGKRITGWSVVSGNKYFEASVPTSSGYAGYFRQIWVNTRRVQQANGDFLNIFPVLYDDPATSQLYDGYIVKTADIKTYTNLPNIRIAQEGKYLDVQQFVDRIISVTPTESAIVMKQPAFNDWISRDYHESPNTIRVVNAFEELDEPGEFYLNQTTQKVYYYPQPGEDINTATIIAPAVETLVKVQGTSSNRIADLQFEGITFQYGNWTAPNTKEIGRGQAELYPPENLALQKNKKSMEGEFWLDYTDKFVIKKCRFEHLASTGIFLLNDNRNTLIEGNIFHDLTAAAVVVGESTFAPAASINKNVTISNNLIRGTGSDFFSASGIYANYSKDLTVSHNDVSDVAYFGINQRLIPNDNSISSNLTGNTQFIYNKVSNYGTAIKYGFGVTDEIAAFYLFGVNDSKVSRNYATFAGKNELLERAYRQDQYGLNNTWDYNVADCKPVRTSFSAYLGLNTNILFDNNYANVVSEYNSPGITFQNFNLESGANSLLSSWSTPAQAIINAAGLEPSYSYLLDELGDGTNLARLGTITTSTEAGTSNSAAKANDGDVNTSWKPLAGQSSSWIQIALDKPYAIDKLQLVPVWNENQPETRRFFEVWVSNDLNFATYNILGGQASKPFAYNPAGQGTKLKVAYNTWDLYSNDSNGYKYIRVVGRSLGLAEIRVYGASQPNLGITGTPTPTPISTDPIIVAPPVSFSYSNELLTFAKNNRVPYTSDVKYYRKIYSPTTITKESNGEIKIQNNGTAAAFTNTIYENETIRFGLRLSESSFGKQIIGFRAPYSTKGISEQASYNLWIYTDRIEFYRTNADASRITFYGTSGKLGAAITNNLSLYSSNKLFEITTENQSNGVKIVVKVNGTVLIDVLDSDPGYLDSPGFLLFNAGNSTGAIFISDGNIVTSVTQLSDPKDFQLRIWPNPVSNSGKVTIEIKGTRKLTNPCFSLTDLSGKTILKDIPLLWQNSSWMALITVNVLSSGVYLIRVDDNKWAEVCGKLIIE